MKVSAETLESFFANRDKKREEVEQSEELRAEDEKLQLVISQVDRAAVIARRAMFDYANGDSITRNSLWANVGYDSETDTLTQARLHGVFEPKLKFLTGKLACVQLYLRAADQDTPTRTRHWYQDGPYDYFALFRADPYEITVPKEAYETDEQEFPFTGDVVQPETKKWREIDYLLDQISKEH